MIINGVQIDPDKLMPKDKLLELLRENGESDRALSHVRERYQAEFGNELIWLYPISDGKHMGICIKNLLNRKTYPGNAGQKLCV